MSRIAELLGRTEIFGMLPSTELCKIAQFCESFSVAAGNYAYVQGAVGDSILILISGKIQIEVNSISVAEYRDPGVAFGETGFLNGLPRSGSIKAVLDSEFIRIPSPFLWQFIEEEPSNGVNILKQIALGSGRKLQHSARTYADRVKKTPLSVFHQNESFIDQEIPGTLFSFDLKRSEYLSKVQNPMVNPREFLTKAVFPFRIHASKWGGIELNDLGDGMNIFFPREKTHPFELIENFLPKFFWLQTEVQKLLEQDMTLKPGHRLDYRISFGYGSLMPSFEEINHQKIPCWRESIGNLFTESSRLMEIEKSVIDPEKSKTVALFSIGFLNEVHMDSPLLQKLKECRQMIAGKHGISWELSALDSNFECVLAQTLKKVA